MFEHQLGLRENPFAAGHHPRFVYPSHEHQEALAHLRYGIENREPFVLITGEVGTGKTTAIYDALSEWGSRAVVALITNSALTRQELLEDICLRFGVAASGPLSKPQALAHLERHLTGLRQQGAFAILLLDEAQNLERELLEEIRLLSNLEIQGEKLLQIFLVGQPELEARLARPELRQLRQRIAIHYRLRPLSPDETEHYIHHRIAVAGGNAHELFPAEACLEVHRLTHGIPREINTVAAQALINAFVDDSRGVEPRHVAAVADDTEFHSVLSSDVPPDASTSPAPEAFHEVPIEPREAAPPRAEPPRESAPAPMDLPPLPVTSRRPPAPTEPQPATAPAPSRTRKVAPATPATSPGSAPARAAAEAPPAPERTTLPDRREPAAPRPLARIVPHPSAPADFPHEAAAPETARSSEYLSPRLRAKLHEEKTSREKSALGWLLGLAAVALVVMSVVIAARFGMPLPWKRGVAAPAAGAGAARQPANAEPRARQPAAPGPGAPASPGKQEGSAILAGAASTAGSPIPPAGPAARPPGVATDQTPVRTTNPAAGPSAPPAGSGVAAAGSTPSSGVAPGGTGPAPAAAAAKPAAPSRRYGVVVGTYLNEERAGSERAQLVATTHLPSRVLTVTEDGAAMYRIVLGSFADRATAERAASDLIRRGLVNEARVVTLAARSSR